MLIVYLSMLETDEDKNKFEELYLKYRQNMYAVAYSILHNTEDSEDAVHTAFLNVAENFSKIKQIPSKDIKAYLVIVVRNSSINIYRKNEKKTEHEQSITEYDIPFDIDFFERLEYDELIKIISELPETSKEIIFLCFLEKFNTDEISKMLNITHNAVRKRIRYAKKLLFQSLEGKENYAGNKV